MLKKYPKSHFLWTMILSIFVLAIVVFLLPHGALADDLYGVNYGAGTGLASEDLRITVVKVIRAILGALGVIALVLVLYAGFIWMTSGGSAEKIAQAKKIMVNAAIGLIIIMMAFAIVQYVFKVLSGEGGSGGPGSGGYCVTGTCSGCLRCVDGQNYQCQESCGNTCVCGGGSGGGNTIFSINEVQTSHGASLNNNLSAQKSNVYWCSKIQTVFNHDIDSASVDSASSDPVLLSDALRINTLATPAEVAGGTWNTYGNTLVFTPLNNVFQFKSALHTSHFPTSLKDSSNRSLSACALGADCNSSPPPDFTWNFYVGSEGDSVRPRVASASPKLDIPYDENVSRDPIISINFSENVDASTLFSVNSDIPNPAHFTLEEIDANGNVVATLNNNTLSGKIDGQSFIIHLVSPNLLKSFTSYRISVRDISDLCGNAIEPNPVQWEFTTNDRVPGVESNYPSNNSGDICPDIHPAINFNTSMYEQVVELTMTNSGGYQANFRLSPHQSSVVNSYGTFRVVDAGDPASPGYNLNDHFRAYEFIPARDLAVNTSYHVSVVTDKILDADRNVLTKSWDFTTSDLQNCVCSPYLSSLSKETGPVGECLTIYGQCFQGTTEKSAAINTINFGSATLIPNIADYASDYVAMAVPTGLSVGAQSVTININYTYPGANNDILSSNAVNFSITAGPEATGPCLWSVRPNSGDRGSKVELSGIRFKEFGTTHEAHFTPSATAIYQVTSASDWTDTSVRNVVVPASAIDGQVNLKNNQGESNPVPFNVNFCGDGGLDSGEECDGANLNGKACSDFSFAGGSLSCDNSCRLITTGCSNAPSVVENGVCRLVCQGGDHPNASCSSSADCLGTDPLPDGACVIATGGLPSPNPRPGVTNVCLNAAISAEFNTDIRSSSLSSANIYLQKCNNENCADDNSDPSNVQSGVIDNHIPASLFISGTRSFLLTPTNNLEPNATYQVTLSRNITGVNNQSMLNDYLWHFTTKSSNAPCPLDSVRVNPSDLTVGSNISVSYTGEAVAPLASTNCSLINGSGYTWNWQLVDNNNPSIGVSLTGSGQNVTVTSGRTPGSVRVEASAEGKKGSGNLNIVIDGCESDPTICGRECPGSVCDTATKRCTPVINSLSPSTGPKGRWVTLQGCYFKSDPGQVEFGSAVVTTYPCDGKWTDKEIIIEVPDSSYTIPSSLPVFVTDKYNLRNASPRFYSLISSCSPGVAVPSTGLPGVCSLDPNMGKWGDGTILNGENFSATAVVNFSGSSGLLPGTINSWTATAIGTKVPANTITGPVSVSVGGCASNAVNFALSSGSVGSPCDKDTVAASCQSDNSLCWPGLVCDRLTCQCATPSRVNIIAGSLSPATNSTPCRNAVIRATFDQLMDHGTLNSNNIKVWSETVSSCSDPINVSQANQNFLARLWSKIKNIFRPSQVKAADGCPIQGTISVYDVDSGSENCSTADGCTVITFSPRLLMAGNSDYAVTIKGGTDGVKSALGGELNTNTTLSGNLGSAYQWKFGAGNEICQIHHVDVDITYHSGNRDITRAKANNDYFVCAGRNNCPDDIDPNASGNQHRYLATAKSSDGQVVQAAYAWSKDDPEELVMIASLSTVATSITPAKKNGQSTVSVVASDFDTNDEIHYGTSTASIAITNFICDNPWPSYHTGFPFTDSDSNCRSRNCLDMTFSTYYCRDAGQDKDFCLGGINAGKNCNAGSNCPLSRCVAPTEDDLPALDYVINGQSDGYCIGGPRDGNTCNSNSQCGNNSYCYHTLKDYLFVVSENDKKKCVISNINCATDADCPAVGDKCVANTDSLGIRIYDNGEHLSPVAWVSKYEKNPAVGSLSTVSGYESMSAGRTTYVNMAVDTNPNGSHNIFTNLFLLSHTDNPKPATTVIYDQLLKNLVFNSNGIYDNKVCLNSGQPTMTYCTKDSDCKTGETCDADQTKLARDTIRLGHLNQMVYFLEKYRGVCSLHGNLSCHVDSDCPDYSATTNPEKCVIAHSTYPLLPSGTYLVGQSVSVWDSWQQTFAQTLGNSPLLDPLNAPASCPEDYNDECWNQNTKDFQCNPGSHMYHYQVLSGGASYRLFTNMEYSTTGWNPSNSSFGSASNSPCQPGAYNFMFTR